MKEEAFLKAIEFDQESEPPIDIDSIVVEESYTGPRLPDGTFEENGYRFVCCRCYFVVIIGGVSVANNNIIISDFDHHYYYYDY